MSTLLYVERQTDAALQDLVHGLHILTGTVEKAVDNVHNLIAKLAPDRILAGPDLAEGPLGAVLAGLGAEFGPMPCLDGARSVTAGGLRLWTGILCQVETLTVLSCNLDDMTPEELGFAMERLLAQGALDVWTQAIGMKKSRPGVLLQVLCRPADQGAMASLLLRHTTTLGIRAGTVTRYARPRTMETARTPYGTVRIKCTAGTRKPEYEDVAAIARDQGLSYREVLELLK